MKHLRMVILLLVLAILASVSMSTPTSAQSGCGIKPIKPIVPIGCKDLVAQCKCDSKGQNCSWQWICVPR